MRPRLDIAAGDREKALQLVPVSHETAARLDRMVELLLDWQQRINLIAPSTVPSVWTRHIADSLQLIEIVPEARTWIDLGSGAGFPGLVLACALADEAGATVHLVESIGKKADYLRAAARIIALPVEVHHVRIEDFAKKSPPRTDVVTARALAPLHETLALAYPWAKTGAQGVFPKGQDVGSELTEASKCWKFEPILVSSKTSPASRIVHLRSWKPHPAKRPAPLL